jgi:DNA-binding NarL/FixJ family response regulator
VADSADAGRERIKIVLADDHTMVRRGLRMVLEAEGAVEVVAEAADIDEALSRTREHRPRVVVLDLNMPGTPTLPAIPRFLDAAPGAGVIVLTVASDPEYARAALAAGASAYVVKDGSADELLDAVRAAASGRTYLDPGLGARLLASRPQAAVAVAVGSTFAGHRIDAIAGKGGMGIVYRATDLTLDRPVALKLIAPSVARDEVFRARFERECRLAAALDHPNVVPVFHAGEEAGHLYVTMRYVDGTDLRALLEEQGRLDPRRAVAVVEQVAGALDEAHRSGLVHRDVKPANILIGRRDGEERVFLTDFGISKLRSAAEELTQTGLAVGTADYMAPEQAEGRDVDGRADVYALGCVLFRALSGKVPFDRDSELDKLWAHVHEPPPPLCDLCPDLPPALGDALATALVKDPRERYQTAGEMACAARLALQG